MKVVNDQAIAKVKTVNFRNQNLIELYKKMTHIILNNVCSLLLAKNINYDYKGLIERLKTLTLECRNNESSEYDEETNTIYVTMYNQLNEKISGSEQVVTYIHELLHFMAFGSDKSLDKEYFAFDEFFTEYLTYMIAMRVGGKKLENYYHQRPGYFNKEDNHFMRKLIIKSDFEKVLAAYFSRSSKQLEEAIPKDVLLNIESYFNYFINLYEKYNLPKKVLNQRLENDPSLKNDKQELDKKLNAINISIDNMINNRKTY